MIQAVAWVKYGKGNIFSKDDMFQAWYTIRDAVYCKSGNFRENFIFANSVKRHIFDRKIRDKGMIYLDQ